MALRLLARSDSLQDDIDSVDIKTSIKSDHSAIIDDLEKGLISGNFGLL